jgi:TPR repeat protein
MPWYVLLMPPILDMICGMIFGFRTYEVTEVSVVDNPNQTFQPTPERCVFVEIEKAAKAGDAAAQYKMGKEYETGFWVEQGEITALYWYQKSADQGYAPAQQMVGRMHFMGEGTVRDYAESYFWYRVAEKTTGNSEWTESVGRYLSAKQIAAAEERAAAWAPKKSG